MSMFARIAEQRIQEAVARGELDNLSLKGEPIPLEDLSAVPEELRMGYKILKNAGVLPEELPGLYRCIGDLLKQRCAGYTAWLLAGNQELAKAVGLRASRRIVLFNGPIECRLLRYELY